LIIKYYESIEHTGRDAKKNTVDKFNLARHTTLNTILSQSDEIVSIYGTKQAGDSRKRLTKARNLEINNHLFDTFKFYGSK